MSSRTPFTNDEDSLLVKYIATYNPSTGGRSGNTLYRTLCEDADKKWKWSRTHPWQSWRDRYCKNQQEFDLKIKTYQIKHNLLPANKNMAEESAQQRQVALSKRKRGNEKEEKRTRVKLEPESSQFPAPAREEPTVLDKRKGKAVTDDSEDDPTLEAQEGITLNVAPIDVVDQKIANESCFPARSTSSSALYPDVEGSLSPTVKPNSHNVNQNSITERQRKPSITYQKSHRIVLDDSQPVASSSKVQLSPPESNAITEAKAISSHRRRKSVVKDDVFFQSSPPTPSPLSPSNATRPKHRNPKLVDGPFGTRFAGCRKSGSNGNISSEDEKDTPVRSSPRKGGNVFKGKGKAVEAITADTVTSTLPRDVEGVPTVLSAARRKTHPVGEHQPRKMSPTYNGQEEVNNLTTSLQTYQGRITHPVQHENFHEVKETPDQLRISQVSSGPSYDVFNSAPAAKPEPGAMGYEREPIKPPRPRHSWTPNNLFRSTDEAIVRRHSMGNLREAQSSAVRKLDLRAEMVKRRFAASSPFIHSREHSVSSTMPYQPSPESSHSRANSLMNFNDQRRRSSIPIADEDREHIEFLGLNVAIQGIARESGFPVEQVWRVYDHYGSIKRSKEWIRLYQKNSARLQEFTHEQMMKNGMGALAIVDEQRTPWSSPLWRSQKREPSIEPTMSTRPSSPKPQENRLKIKPLPPDSQRSPSEYSPPHETRAGEYNRLVGQGRVEEAMLREHRRASGSGGVFPRLRNSPAIWETPHQSSPSTMSIGTETVERGADGIEDEHDVVDQLLDGSNNGEDRKSLQEEEEILFLSASEEMVDKLRTIEENMDPDYMLRWVAARLGEMEDDFRSPSSSS